MALSFQKFQKFWVEGFSCNCGSFRFRPRRKLKIFILSDLAKFILVWFEENAEVFVLVDKFCVR